MAVAGIEHIDIIAAASGEQVIARTQQKHVVGIRARNGIVPAAASD